MPHETMTRRAHLRQLTAAAAALALPASIAGAWARPAGAQYAAPQSADAVPRMTMDDFKARVDKGSVVVVDVRSVADYRLGHIPGARSVPLNEVATRVAELRNLGKPIVTYCT